ncbi:hypothetical protein A3A63_02395 [Candidatus Gottesmanbacteria bacterium RIFCSPLOWO2_01_FULL_46_9]|uniref:Uncharacterized protein n=1 Tax=Candidatus Gottesmanbacteria bacterium RIFCSPLOWO2_01_FULL_46_9 TaxID=1798394 RepID=A0A1F6AXL4_9BACT|nr:MAG: hypothetical protein A3A63_02395 [Candidatus Gottesmanbacteria bacterium RIFCSPLOWO2_01_FULL_46_9]
MRWNEVIRKLKKLKFKEGVRKTHYTIWNCPCTKEAHPIGVGNHLTEECRFNGLKRQLGPHADDFGI